MVTFDRERVALVCCNGLLASSAPKGPRLVVSHRHRAHGFVSRVPRSKPCCEAQYRTRSQRSSQPLPGFGRRARSSRRAVTWVSVTPPPSTSAIQRRVRAAPSLHCSTPGCSSARRTKYISKSCGRGFGPASISAQRYCRSAAGARGSAATDAPVRLQRRVGQPRIDSSQCTAVDRWCCREAKVSEAEECSGESTWQLALTQRRRGNSETAIRLVVRGAAVVDE